MPAILGYWNIRGLAQGIRNLLHYAGEEYQEKFYEMGPEPDFNKDDWLKEKFTLGLKFPNLPYYIDGETKLTQSLAIYRYLGRKHGMAANNEAERVLMDMLEQQLLDVRMGFVMSFVHPKYEEKLKVYLNGFSQILKPFSDQLGNNSWLLNDRITYLDFLFYDILSTSSVVSPGCLDTIPQNLKDYKQRFEALPQIKKYFDSKEYKNRMPFPPKAFYDRLRK